ncbi:MAG: hypothetical protein AAFV95_10475 [Bacteroidota bacterium]
MSQSMDHFEQYYTEKIWELIPSVYRMEDGPLDRPGPLRQIVEILAGQAAVVRRSQDRLWEDQFIEWCSDWAVPYIADLVATRLLPLENKRGRRVDVAKTIYYRRRKGTPRVLEELIADISGWDGKLVENFRRLGRDRHGLDPLPAESLGRFSRTPSGGLADLRNPFSSELVGSPFDEFHYTLDVRRQSGTRGQYNISKLAFHLYRLSAYEVREVTVFTDPAHPGRFGFDPSGRNCQLFARRNRPAAFDWDQWCSAVEWELPVPIRCRLLGHAEYELLSRNLQLFAAQAPALPAGTIAELQAIRDQRFRNESQLRAVVQSILTTDLTADQWPVLLRHTLAEDCGKNALWPLSVSIQSEGNALPIELLQAANLEAWNISPPAEKWLIVDPERGRFRFVNDPVPPSLSATYHYGFSAPIGAGTYERPTAENCPPAIQLANGGIIREDMLLLNDVNQIMDSHTYGPVENIDQIQKMVLQAANQERPYLRLGGNWELASDPGSDACLVIDGLWIGANASAEIILRGDFESIIIRNATLDPGGLDLDINDNPLASIQLVIEAKVEKLLIEESICGPITTRNGGLVEECLIRDSIVQSIDPATFALQTEAGRVEMQRSTVFGNVQLHRLWASEVFIDGQATVRDTQNGCFRFSAVQEGSRVPKAYESHAFNRAESRHWFNEREFGRAAYAQLSDTAPESIRRGAENQSEIGAFSRWIHPIKQDSLRVKIEEYMPFGLVPSFIHQT